ncbi:SOS response-associated peptidase family protein [Alteraurantiacibacter buctensis]|uniref:DUF159 family protein n=1 Tax=Alteraurantiacibacter buctensis TaxID=1503981 RepID=A0A844Z1U7_9SPHN|nr:SOS response-associated peptidase family protein [Alteraurantiacibacter buctensis]MXO73130.1 DUF159 family protein [Alteraurantiacibacter buctensis]
MPAFYRLDAPAAAIARAFAVPAGDDPWQGGVVAPGQFAPVITAGREFVAGARLERQPRRLVPRLWGVPPPPSAPDQRRAVLIVRNAESPFWIGNLRNSEFRCLVPATGFAEWGSGIDTEGRRLRHLFRAGSGGLLAMAGVWKDAEVPGFALVTCPARGEARAMGVERLPVVVAPADYDTWLHGGWDRAGALLAPAPEGTLRLLD